MTDDLGAMTKRQRWQHLRSTADALGPITTVEPASRHPADNSPQVGPGRVYVTRTGQVFHPYWCRVVGDKWDADPDGLLVTTEDAVGQRRQCKTCNPLA